MDNTTYFLIRRIHSLSGVIPLGVFLIGHLTTNSMAAFGQEPFADKVELIHMLGPLLPLVEAAVIFIPLTIHVLLGIFIALQSKNNPLDLGYARNWAYTFQRWSGWIALVFIIYHTVTLRFMDAAALGKWKGLQLGDLTLRAGDLFFIHLSDQFQNPIIVALYLIGGLAVVYHFANGLCTFCMTWGITVGPKSQLIMAWIAFAIGMGLMGMIVASIAGFYFRYDPAIIQQLQELAPNAYDIGQNAAATPPPAS